MLEERGARAAVCSIVFYCSRFRRIDEALALDNTSAHPIIHWLLRQRGAIVCIPV